MAEKQGKIEWHRMGWRWWLESTAKIALLIGLFSLVAYIVGDNQPKWVYSASVFGTFVVGVLLLPLPPREGDENFGLMDSLVGTGWIAVSIAGMVLLGVLVIVYFTVVPAILTPIFEFAFEHIIAILLSIIAVTLIGIYRRLGQKR